jgi:uncharacterized protein (DUF1015 family)
MARIFPFRSYRYSPTAGPLDKVATQPYDKIYPDMQQRYLESSPFNFVRIILGPRLDTDNETENVYTRAATYFKQWIRDGILVQDARPSLFAYFQEFDDPDSGEHTLRKGFIGLAQVEDYENKVVFRHEHTLSGPKKDRLELLNHTSAHLEQLFLMYPDPAGEVDAILDAAAKGEPAGRVVDEYGAINTIWQIDDPATVARIQSLMADKKLVIADGHHRYETALNYAKAHPESPDAQRVMMTFVNVHSAGLRILATHRVLGKLADFDARAVLAKVGGQFLVESLPDTAALRNRWAERQPGTVRFGLLVKGDPKVYAVETARKGDELDLHVLHRELIGGVLGITPDDVRDQKCDLKYVRGIDAAEKLVREGESQIALLVEPVTVQQVADISLAGGVMPQKSTDFYPKLLSGLTIYRIEK